MSGRGRSNEAGDWKPSGFFVLRSPLLPIEALLDLSEGLEAPGLAHDPGALEGAVVRDREVASGALRAILRSNAMVREALFVASPSLDSGVETWLRDADDPRARGVPESTLRYFARMAARPTPFGLFSGCTVGSFGARTQLVLAPRSAYRRHSRLDMHYLDALSEALLADRELRHALTVRLNTAAYATPTHYRCVESHADAETRARRHRLFSIERTPYLDSILTRSARGATIEDLAGALTADDPELMHDEATAFVDEVVGAQLLSPDLAPAITGAEPLAFMIHSLRAAAPGQASAAVLESVAARLLALDKIGQPTARYRDAASALEALRVRPDIERLFHVDLYKPAVEVQLGPAVLRELDVAIRVVQQVNAPSEHPDLLRFRRAFVERYDAREVPLVEALDEELGIGFPGETTGSSEPSPLLEGLAFPDAAGPARVAFGPRERQLARGIDAAVRDSSLEWVLTPDDIAALGAKSPVRLPDAFAFFGTISAPSADAADRGELTLHVHRVQGPSGATLLGRFCHGEPSLREHVEAHLRAEEAMRPDAIFAEIVHLPEGRLGNVIARPCLRSYEIVYLGASGVDEPHRIRVDDLLVSVRKDRIVLRSRRLGREVVPRMTSAHNFSRSTLSTYRFLCALQVQDGCSLGFSWGPFASAPFLPRARVGRIVLSPATWNLSNIDLAPVLSETGGARYAAMRRLRERLRIPRWAGLSDGDNVLPVDLDHPLHVASFAHLAKSRGDVRLIELAIAVQDTCVEGPEGHFTHEIVVPFVRDAAPMRSVQRTAPPTATSQVRTFAPGSEWLYAKIYTGTAAADVVLRETVTRLLVEPAIRSWFFVRYGDPEWHLRVRFRGDPSRLTNLLGLLHEALAPKLSDGRIWRVQLDTYEREVERYGGPAGVELAEEIFHADSDAVLAVLAALD